MTKHRQFMNNCALALGLLAAGNAVAGTVPMNIDGSSVFTTVDSGPSYYSISGPDNLAALQQYDGPIGTLESVSLKIVGDLNYSVSISSDPDGDPSFIIDPLVSTEVNINTTIGIGAGVPIGANIELHAEQTQFDGLGCDQVAGFSCDGANVDSFFVDTEEIFLGADMAAFMGTGDLSAVIIDLFFGLDNPMLSNLSDAFISVDANFMGDVTVTYTVSEVPLPAAAWLFISALGGLVVAKRKQLNA